MQSCVLEKRQRSDDHVNAMREHTHTFIDGQVHVYPGFDINLFLSSALGNFTRAFERAGVEGRALGVLMLTDMAKADGFSRFKRLLNGRPEVALSSTWHLEQVPSEEGSLLFEHRDGSGLVAIAGRQINTAERIEVLSLGSPAPVADAMSLSQTISSVRTKGGLPVLPWGAGKWLGARGRLILKTLDEFTPDELMFGDNGIRPVFWPRSPILDRAAELGYKIVSGTDPLPCPHEAKRAGTFGCWIAGTLSLERPAASVKALLKSADTEARPYGRAAGAWRFLRDQTMIRLKSYA